MTTEREYQLTRVGDGDYVFPSNDACWLWRVYRYREDGSAQWVNGGAPILGWFWSVARFDGSLAKADRLVKQDPDEFLSWSNWDHWSDTMKTRREAIDEALRATPLLRVRA